MHRLVQRRTINLRRRSACVRNEGRFHFNWEGAVVYDGEVYDHVTYRLRGANGRYHPGKRSFRIRFKEGRLLEAKDQDGNLFPTKWRELTTGKGQGNRGSVTFALNEVVNYFLWNKVGVPCAAHVSLPFSRRPRRQRDRHRSLQRRLLGLELGAGKIRCQLPRNPQPAPRQSLQARRQLRPRPRRNALPGAVRAHQRARIFSTSKTTSPAFKPQTGSTPTPITQTGTATSPSPKPSAITIHGRAPTKTAPGISNPSTRPPTASSAA